MISPSELQTGRNESEKARHAEICNLFMEDNLSTEVIASKLGITHQAVSYVLRNNKEALKIDREFEKLKRVNKLTRVLQSLPDTISKTRDFTDVTRELRAEIEGDKQINVVAQFFQIEAPEGINNRLSNSQKELPAA